MRTAEVQAEQSRTLARTRLPLRARTTKTLQRMALRVCLYAPTVPFSLTMLYYRWSSCRDVGWELWSMLVCSSLVMLILLVSKITAILFWRSTSSCISLLTEYWSSSKGLRSWTKSRPNRRHVVPARSWGSDRAEEETVIDRHRFGWICHNLLHLCTNCVLYKPVYSLARLQPLLVLVVYVLFLHLVHIHRVCMYVLYRVLKTFLDSLSHFVCVVN